MSSQQPSADSQLAAKLAALTRPVSETAECLLASALYDGDQRVAVLKLYDPQAGRFWLWRDNTGHRPYCYTRLPMEELAAVKARKDVVDIVEEERLDLLRDEKVKLRKIITTDPLAIGGGNNSIRDQIKAWEADIKYYENYAYDRGLRMGTYYRVAGGKVVPSEHPVPERVARSLEQILKRNPETFAPYIRAWAELLGEPLCDFRRVALDIEVANESGRLPDVEDPTQPVIAVSFFSEGEKVVYLLAGGKDRSALEGRPYQWRVFDDEPSLLRAVMSKILDYPVLLTFNGDDFDLRYLRHRAERLGLQEEENPIQLERVAASLKHGVHIDLYQFFRNRSIQVYAFSNKYTEHTLNGISEALLNKSKIEFEGEVGELPLDRLADYCLNDSQLTYELTTMGGSVVMKLLLVISRIGKMPINDVSRLGVSNWIRSMLFFEHRKMGALIPRPDELAEKGGASSEAIIKGKKYKGGLVIEPKPGVFFDVSVLDFASLYPSLIKVHNLSYETVDCPHEECRKNVIPETSSWVCQKRSGIISLVTGSLRDLRVGHYKPLTKDQSLSPTDRELYNIVTQGLKVFLNASYGVLGFETFAFYCLPVAEATAALGRYAITKTISRCTELGINVLYSDSVTGERCVTLLDPFGHVLVKPMEELFNAAGRFATRPDGKDEAYPQGWKALSMDTNSGAVGFKPVTAVIRHRTDKKVFRVSQKWGSTRVTEDHSLIVKDGTALRLETPLNLSGKSLVRIDEIPSAKDLEAVDIYEVLRPYTFKVSYKGREKTLAPKCDDEWVWYGWTDRQNPIRARRFIRVGTPEFLALVELTGAYVPEGSSSTPDTTRSRLGASIACSDTAWLERLRLDYLQLFKGAKAGIIRSSPGPRHLEYVGGHGELVQLDYEDKTSKLQMMNELAAVFFKALCGQKSTGKRLPDFIFSAPTEYKRVFLDNLVKGDGSRVFGRAYSADYRRKNFRYETKSLRVASGLAVLLSQLGTRYTLKYRASKSTYAFATCSSYNSRLDSPVVVEEAHDGFVYDLSVEGNHNFVDSCGNIVLKNTDSLFLQNPSKEQVLAVTRWADSDLGVELDLDKAYRYVAFSSRKKNYFGVLPDGTADIKGLTGKKSVDGKTPILVKEDGDYNLTTVERVYESFKAGRSVEVTSITDSLDTVWVPVSDATKHKVEEIFEVKSSKGRSLRLSGDHSVFIMNERGELRCVATRDLKEGDVLVGAQLIRQAGTDRTLLTPEHLTADFRIGGSLVHSGKAHATTGVPLPSKLPLDEDLGLLLGVYAAEGSRAKKAGSRNNCISQSQIVNPEVCEAIEAAWKRLLGRAPKVYRKKHGNNSYYLPMLHSDLFASLCGGTSSEKRVPSVAFNAGDPFVRAFLRGLFSGDGYGDGRRVNLASSSKDLLVGTAYLLARFDIDTRLRAFRVKGKEYHQLSVIGTESRKEFYRRIGFLQKRFTVKVATGRRNKELIPISTSGLVELKAAIAAGSGLPRFRSIRTNRVRLYNLSKLDEYNTVIGSLLDRASDEQRSQLMRIARMINVRDVTYDEVVEVRQVPGSCVMYDFAVPHFERFVAGDLPTLLHNSQTPEYLKKTFYDALDILSSVQTQSDFERARAETKALLTKMITDLKNRKVPVEQLAFNVMMSKETEKYAGTTPQHVRAAKLLQERGREIKAGEIIAYVKTKNPPYVKPAELARVDEIDADKYIEYAHSMFDQMLDALDFSFDEMLGATTLDSFWSG